MWIKAFTQSIWQYRYDECFLGLFFPAMGIVAVFHMFQRAALSHVPMQMENGNFWKVFLKFAYCTNRLFLIFLNRLLQFASVGFCLESSRRELQLPASDLQILSLHVLKSVNVISEACCLRIPSERLWDSPKRNSLPWPLLPCSVLNLQSSKQTQELWYLVRHRGRLYICPRSLELPVLIISFDRNFQWGLARQ